MRQPYGHPLLSATLTMLLLLVGCSRGDNQVDSAIGHARIRVQMSGLTEEQEPTGTKRDPKIPPDITTICLCAIFPLPAADDMYQCKLIKDECRAEPAKDDNRDALAQEPKGVKVDLEEGKTETSIEIRPNVEHLLMIEARNHRQEVIWKGRDTVNVESDKKRTVKILLEPVEIVTKLSINPDTVHADFSNDQEVSITDKDTHPLQGLKLAIPPGTLMGNRVALTLAEVYNPHVDMPPGADGRIIRTPITSLSQRTGLIISIRLNPPIESFNQPMKLFFPHDSKLLEELGIKDPKSLRLFQFVESQNQWYPLAIQETLEGMTTAMFTTPVGYFTLGQLPKSTDHTPPLSVGETVTISRTHVSETKPYEIHVLANDYDLEGDDLTIYDVKVLTPGGGSAILSGNAKSILYTLPTDTQIKDVNLSYRIGDPRDVCVPSKQCPNSFVFIKFITPPLAIPDDYKTEEDKPLIIKVSEGVLSNDLNTTGIQARIKSAEDVSHGDLEFSTDGSFIYTPRRNFHGLDGFTYEIIENIRLNPAILSEAKVTIAITPVNDPPRLSISAIEGTLSGNLLETVPLEICRTETLMITMEVDADIDETTESPESLLSVVLAGTKNGFLSLASTAGLTFEPPGSPQNNVIGMLRFTGSQSAIERALSPFRWQTFFPNSQGDSIKITVDDHVNNEDSSDEKSIIFGYKRDALCGQAGAIQADGASDHWASSNTLYAAGSPGDDVKLTSASTHFIVDNLDDIVDVAAGDGICASLDGSCTLRAALQEANASPGIDIIFLPIGVHRLGHIVLESSPTSPTELEITDHVKIIGAGEEQTFVDGGGIGRVFEIMDDTIVELRDMTIQNGFSLMGGGIVSRGILTLIGVAVRHNMALFGGALFNKGGSALLIDSRIESNQALFYGGGLVNADGGELVLTHSMVSHNTSSHGYGGGLVNTGNLTIGESWIRHNRARGDDTQRWDGWPSGVGGGIVNDGEGTVTLDHSYIIENTALDRHDHGIIMRRGNGVFNDGAAFDVRDSVIAKNGAGKRAEDDILDHSGTLRQRRTLDHVSD